MNEKSWKPIFEDWDLIETENGWIMGIPPYGGDNGYWPPGGYDI